MLDYESKPSEQVQLLLKLDENKPALLKAIESGDTDLVYMVILGLRDNMPLADFKVTILLNRALKRKHFISGFPALMMSQYLICGGSENAAI